MLWYQAVQLCFLLASSYHFFEKMKINLANWISIMAASDCLIFVFLFGHFQNNFKKSLSFLIKRNSFGDISLDNGLSSCCYFAFTLILYCVCVTWPQISSQKLSLSVWLSFTVCVILQGIGKAKLAYKQWQEYTSHREIIGISAEKRTCCVSLLVV